MNLELLFVISLFTCTCINMRLNNAAIYHTRSVNVYTCQCPNALYCITVTMFANFLKCKIFAYKHVHDQQYILLKH